MSGVDPTIAAILEELRSSRADREREMQRFIERQDRQEQRQEQRQDQQMQILQQMLQQMTVANPQMTNANPPAEQPIEQPAGREIVDRCGGGGGGGGIVRGGGHGNPGAARVDHVPRWDSGIKLEIPQFTGSLAPEEFLDWLSTVDELFLLREVPEDKKVGLVAIRFKDRAAAWWQSFRYQRYLDGMPVLANWNELKREMRQEFLPFNYRQTLFRNLQSLTQGSKSVEEYTLEFYRLVARNQLRETQEQLVARYLHGLRPAIQDALQVHSFSNITDVQTKARVVEDSLTRANSRGITLGRGVPPFSRNSAAISPASSASSRVFNQPTPQGQNSGQSSQGPGPQPVRQPVNKANIICHRCQQKGHYAYECPRLRSQLLIQEGIAEEDVGEFEDVEMAEGETYVIAPEDVRGESLVLRRICLAPRAGEDWRRRNIFSTRCTIGGKVCKVIIDTGSCENVISQEAVQKLHLKTEPHPVPYRFGWINNEIEVKVSERCRVEFSFGPQYSSSIYCDVVPMDATHLLLGRPWQYDNHVTYDGFTHCYTINRGPKKVVLQPMREGIVDSKKTIICQPQKEFEGEHFMTFHGDNPSLRTNSSEEGEPDAELVHEKVQEGPRRSKRLQEKFLHNRG